MADAKWQKLEDKITGQLQIMIERGRDARAYFMRRLLPKYREYQMLRWTSENQGQWPKLTSYSYMKWKLRKYSSAIGQGEKMMIASGELLKSALVQPGSHVSAIADQSSTPITVTDIT